MPLASPGPLLRLLVPVLLVLGLVGMHGLVGGPEAAGHGAPATAAFTSAHGVGAGAGGAEDAGHVGHAGHVGNVDPSGGTAPDGHVHLLELCLAVLGGLLAVVILRPVLGLIRGASGPARRALVPSGLLRRAPDLLALQVCRT